VLDGVYRRGIDGAPEFVDVPAPTDEALQAVLHKTITRTMKMLTRRGVLVEEDGSTYMADNDGDSGEARVLRPLHAAACTCRIAFGPRAGQKVLTLQGAMPRDADVKQNLCADISGFSLHAAQGCRDRLRPGSSTPRNCGRVIRVNPQPRPLACAVDRDQRHLAGHHQPQSPHSEPRPMVLATPSRPQRHEECV